MVESIKKLREKCKRMVSMYGNEKIMQPYPYIRFLRFCSIYFVKLFLYTPITANQVTMVSLMVAIIGSGFFISANPFYWLIGFALLQLFFILDCADGEVARYRKSFSPIGRAFDLFGHSVVLSFVFGGMSWGIYNELGNESVFLFGFFVITASLLHSFAGALKNYHLFEYVLMKGGTRKNRKDVYSSGRIIKSCVVGKVFSFFTIPFLILGAVVLDIIFRPAAFSFMNMNFVINWRYALLMMMALGATIMLIAHLRAMLKISDKFRIEKE